MLKDGRIVALDSTANLLCVGAGVGKLYINGNLSKTQTFSASDFGNWKDWDLSIANELISNTSSRDWLGKIYTVAIYNRALSASEVQQNYDAGED